MALLLALILLAAPPPTPRWVAVYTNVYQIHLEPRETKPLVLPVPAKLTTVDRPMSFVWRIARPSPAPRFVILEQCVAPEQCYPATLRPDGQGSGTVRTTFRITNGGYQAVDVEFRYTVWDAR